MTIYVTKLYKSEYQALNNAKGRCHRTNHPQYQDYGARGISVCDEWRGKNGFANFLDSIGPKPSPDLTLERIDNDKGYEPDNVRWATKSEQRRNQRKRRPISNQTRDRLRSALTGRPSPLRGRKQSPELIAKRFASRRRA